MQTIYDELKPKIHERLVQEVRDTSPILDLGCGDGQLVNLLASKLRERVYGVDISDTGFEGARKEAKSKRVSHLVRYVKGDARNLWMFEEESFGAIVSIYALHEFEDPLVVLRELRRILKIGGKLLIVDFTKGGLAEEIWGERYYTPDEMESALRCSGFKKMKRSFLYEDVILFSCTK